MNAVFAVTIAKRLYFGHDSNAQIAQDLSINKNTVALIRKICKNIVWNSHLDEEDNITRCSKKYHVSRAIIRAIYPIAIEHRYH